MYRRDGVIAGAIARDVEFLIVADAALVAIEYLQRSDRRAGISRNLETSMTCLAQDGVHAVRDIARRGGSIGAGDFHSGITGRRAHPKHRHQ